MRYSIQYPKCSSGRTKGAYDAPQDLQVEWIGGLQLHLPNKIL